MEQETINIIRRDIQFILKHYRDYNFFSEVYTKLEKIDCLLLLEELKNEDDKIPKGFIKVTTVNNEPILLHVSQIDDFGDGFIKIDSESSIIRIKQGKKRIIEMLNKNKLKK